MSASTTDRLEELAKLREELATELERVYGELLDEVLRQAEAGDANVTKIAERAGIARATVYNELARRQEHRDTLSGNGHPPRPAPADADR